jgi:hypothetical protein
MAEGQHAARLTALADGAAPPRVGLALFEEMLAGNGSSRAAGCRRSSCDGASA